jgi:hypothetical protein
MAAPTNQWRRLSRRARLFIAWLVACCAAPSLLGLGLELVDGTSVASDWLPWLGFTIAMVSLAALEPPRSASANAWLEQLRRRLASETLP